MILPRMYEKDLKAIGLTTDICNRLIESEAFPPPHFSPKDKNCTGKWYVTTNNVATLVNKVFTAFLDSQDMLLAYAETMKKMASLANGTKAELDEYVNNKLQEYSEKYSKDSDEYKNLRKNICELYPSIETHLETVGL